MLRLSAWKTGYQLERKIAVDPFLQEERTRLRQWQFLGRFDFNVGITIIVETNKKVELFPWTNKVQAAIWIAECIKIFLLQNLQICFRKQTEIFWYIPYQSGQVPDDRHQSGPIEPCGDCGSFVPTETKAGMKVSNLYISQVKRKCGIEVGKNYNLPKNEDSRQPQCPEDKESAIVEALKHFKMNS